MDAYIQNSGQFNSSQLVTLQQASQQTNSRKGMEENIATVFGGLQWCSNRLIRHYQNDSTNLALDSVRYWLGQKLSMEGLYGQVESWLDEENTTEALNLIATIPLTYTLSTEQTTEFNYYTALKQLRIDLINSNRGYFDLDSSEKTQLQSIADNSQGLAGLQAENWLNLAYGGTYQKEPKLPTGSSLSTPGVPAFDIAEDPQRSWINVQPNPAKNLATFQFNLPAFTTTANLVIVDINGRMIKNIEVTKDHIVYHWNTRQIEGGVYFYRLVTDQGESRTYKLAIIK